MKTLNQDRMSIINAGDARTCFAGIVGGALTSAFVGGKIGAKTMTWQGVIIGAAIGGVIGGIAGGIVDCSD